MSDPARTFVLIRHGQADGVGSRLNGRLPGVHLTDEGRAQARRLVPVLRDFDLRYLLSSPRERAVETAEPLSRALGLPLVTHAAFDEIDYGDWTGRSLEELADRPEWRSFHAFRGARRIPGGESLLEAQSRVWAGLESLAREPSAGPVAIFTHSELIKAVVLKVLGAPWEFSQRFEVSPGSITILHLGEAGPFLEQLNARP